MELGNIFWIFGLFAFIQMWGLSARIRRLERAKGNNSEIADLTEIIVTHIGKQIDTITFYEDEEDEDDDLECLGKNEKAFIEEVDEKWVLLRVEKAKKTVRKLIRISSIKGIALKK